MTILSQFCTFDTDAYNELSIRYFEFGFYKGIHLFRFGHIMGCWCIGEREISVRPLGFSQTVLPLRVIKKLCFIE